MSTIYLSHFISHIPSYINVEIGIVIFFVCLSGVSMLLISIRQVFLRCSIQSPLGPHVSPRVTPDKRESLQFVLVSEEHDVHDSRLSLNILDPSC